MEVNLPQEFEDRLIELIAKYPQKQSAVMPALYLAQEHFGYISEEAIQWVAPRVDMAPVKVMEIATFYTMYYKKKVGRYHFQICRTLPCALRGAGRLTSAIKDKFKLEPGEVSACGMWSYEEVECLGSCGTAPMCQINDRYFENLTTEDIERIVNEIDESKGDLRLSTLTDSIGTGLSSYPMSSVEGTS